MSEQPPVLGPTLPVTWPPAAPEQPALDERAQAARADAPAAQPTLADRIAAVGHWARDTGLGITGFILVLIVALAGWTASFIGLHDFGVKHMGLEDDTAWLVPITFDGAAAGLSLVVFRASINGRGASTWRALIVVFTALSAWVNYKHIADPTGRWIASFMPPAAVILFEGLMSEARAAASRRLGHERPRLHPLRWVIDRSGTWAMYRAYVLGIELPDALKQAAVSAESERAHERPEPEPKALTERPDERAHERPSERAHERPRERQDERPRERAQKPKSERRERAQKRPKMSAPKSVVDRRRERTRRLYDELGKRPEWTEIRDALVAEKLATKDISRATCQRVRDAIEAKEPKLAALGSDNVRALTGS